MANLKEVRNRIASVTSTQQITKAMKMVSAAKLKRATNAIIQLRPYADKLKEMLANLSASLEDGSSPFLEERAKTCTDCSRVVKPWFGWCLQFQRDQNR